MLLTGITVRGGVAASGLEPPGSESIGEQRTGDFSSTGPGAARECPSHQAKDAQDWLPVVQPPDREFNSNKGKLKMPPHVIATGPPVKHSAQVFQFPRPSHDKMPWSLDQLSEPFEGMVQVEGCIPVEVLESILRLLHTHGAYLEIDANGALTVRHTPQ